MTGQYQNVILTLSNGERIIATIPAKYTDVKDLRVIDVKFTKPKDLPEDCHFSNLDEASE